MQPTKVLRSQARRSLSIAIWEKEGRYSLKLQSGFKDKATGGWKNTDYLFAEDILPAAHLFQMAMNWIEEEACKNPKAPRYDEDGNEYVKGDKPRRKPVQSDAAPLPDYGDDDAPSF